MENKKKNMLSNIRFLALFGDMKEITVDKKYARYTDLTFEKDNKVYGFITEFDCYAKEIKQKTGAARKFCDYIYVVTNDTAKRKYIEDNIAKGTGIICYSDSFGLGMVWQELKNPICV